MSEPDNLEPQIGVDEWVATADARRERHGGVRGRAIAGLVRASVGPL